MKTLVLFLALALAGCGTTGHTPPTGYILVDEQAKKLGDLSFTFSEMDFDGVKYPVIWSSEQIEGDTYKVAHLSFSKSVKVNFYFDNGRLWRIRTTSRSIVDKFHLGVGSTLQQLQKHWPAGRFILGYADGNFANFVTGGHIIYSFDASAFPPSCFSSHAKCAPGGARVDMTTIYPEPTPAP